MTIEIIDNFVDDWYAEQLCDFTLNNKSFPWTFLQSMSGYGQPEKVSGAHLASDQWGFQHLVMDHQGDYNSEYASIFVPLVNALSEHNNKNVYLVRIKVGLVLPVNGGGVAYPHVDYISPHKTLVYYVNRADGDTVFYDEWHGDSEDRFHVDERVSPKMGRAVIFDGLQYHSTEYPSSGPRCFININYKV